MEKPDEKLKKILLIVGITGVVYASLKYLLPLVIPFLIAYIIALLLRPSSVWLKQHFYVKWKGKHYHLSLGILGGIQIFLLLTVLGVGFYAGGKRLCQEVQLLIANLPSIIDRVDQELTGFCFWTEELLNLRRGCMVVLLQDMLRSMGRSTKEAVMPFLVVNSMTLIQWILKLAIFTVILFVASVLSIQEMDELRKRRDSSMFQREFAMLSHRLMVVGNAFVKTQGTIILLTMMLSILTLLLLGNPYCIMLGIGIGLLDALPVFGTGTVLIPWAILSFVGGSWGQGCVLLALYLVCYFLRQILEAKLMGDKVGLTPLETLAAMYVGLQLFGLIGFVLGPIGLLIIEDTVEAFTENENSDR